MQSHAPLVRSSDRIEGGLSVIYTVTDGEVLTPKAFLHLLRTMLAEQCNSVGSRLI